MVEDTPLCSRRSAILDTDLRTPLSHVPSLHLRLFSAAAFRFTVCGKRSGHPEESILLDWRGGASAGAVDPHRTGVVVEAVGQTGAGGVGGGGRAQVSAAGGGGRFSLEAKLWQSGNHGGHGGRGFKTGDWHQTPCPITMETQGPDLERRGKR